MVIETVTRGLLSRLLKKHLDDDGRAEVAAADAYLDEALNGLDMEEPALVKWLDSDLDVQRLSRANLSAVYWLVNDGLRRGRNLDQVIMGVDQLYGRVMYATAWRASLRERGMVALPRVNKDGVITDYRLRDAHRK